MMHVACVNQDPGIAPGRRKGAAVHLAAMREAFRAAGCRVSEIDAKDDAEVLESLEKAHAAAPLEFVYERYALRAFAASDFARARGIPLVIEVNAPLAEEEREHRPARASAVDLSREHELFSRAALVIAVSSALETFALERGASPERVLVRGNAVDPQLFHPVDPEERARRSLAPAGSFVLGFHGRLRPWHNFELLMRAAARLLAHGIPAHLVCIGEGDYVAHCRGMLPDGRWSHIPWLPHQEVARCVACFDVLPLTYEAREGFYFSPLKLLEAMACEVVPVVPDVGDLPGVVGHEVEGLVYPAGDLEALVRALQSLHERPAWREELGARARTRAERSSWLVLARDILGRLARSTRGVPGQC
jgi:glycosyltransferase involved in cell wall biosynthesis